MRRSRLTPKLRVESGVHYRLGDDEMWVYAVEPKAPRPDEDSRHRRKQVLPPAQTDFDTPSTSVLRVRQRCVWSPLVQWVRLRGRRVFRHAVAAGNKSPSCFCFVGRVVCAGQLMAGAVLKNQRLCTVAYDGRVHKLPHYEMLQVERGTPVWVACKGGDAPANALPTGLTLHEAPIYAARAVCEGVWVLGQLISGEKFCRVAFRSVEQLFSEYEVLTLKPWLEPESSLRASPLPERPPKRICLEGGPTPSLDEVSYMPLTPPSRGRGSLSPRGPPSSWST